MKKTFIFISLLLIVVLSVFALVGCEKKQDEPEQKENISYIQTGFYLGKSGDFEVKIIKGNKELLFVADGKTNDCKDFCTLTLTPSSVDLFDNEYSFVIKGDSGEVEGKLDKDSFGAFFEQEVDVSALGKIESVTIKYGKKNQEIPVQDMLENSISAKDALEKAKKVLSERLSADDKDREIYIRLINNTVNPTSEYYWYVAFIANPTDYFACLVSPKDGSIISQTK